MRLNKLLLVSIFVLAIFTLGAVSAAEDVSVDEITADGDDAEEPNRHHFVRRRGTDRRKGRRTGGHTGSARHAGHLTATSGAASARPTTTRCESADRIPCPVP